MAHLFLYKKALYLLQIVTYCKIQTMLTISLIYVVAVILFIIFVKVGYFHIHKNKSIADVTSESFMSTFTQVSIAIIVLTILALIIEFIYLT